MKTNKHGRPILKNPGNSGKYYVLIEGKKVYTIEKNIESDNHPSMFTVDQLKTYLTSLGYTGLSKLKKDELWSMIQQKLKKPKNSKVYYVYTPKNRYKTFSQIIQESL